MKARHLSQAVSLLNVIVENRLLGVVRYTQYSLAASGYDKLSLSQLFTDCANQSLQIAQDGGKVLTAMNERPQLVFPAFTESPQQSSREMLLRSLNQERKSLLLHHELVQLSPRFGPNLETISDCLLHSAESLSRRLFRQLGTLETSVCVKLSA